MATKLKNLRLTSVDLVRAGANQEADICLYKSADPPPVENPKPEITVDKADTNRFDVISEVKKGIDCIVEITKYNDRHDPKTGQFAPKGAGVGSATGGKGKAIITQQRLSKENVDKHIAKVRREASNTYGEIKKEKVDLAAVKKRGNCDDEEAKRCVKLADGIYERAKSMEPKITNDVVSVVGDNGGKMFGLAYRMKQTTSMAGKISSDAKDDNVSIEKAASKIKDSVRYTAVFENKDFVNGYKNVKSKLEAQGYEEVRCKNFFQKYEEGKSCQKAVQCVYKNKEGLNFELQFHTYETQGAKEVNHPFYEEQRAKTTKKIRADKLDKAMTKISSYAEVPKGVLDIAEHG